MDVKTYYIGVQFRDSKRKGGAQGGTEGSNERTRLIHR